jgi:general stress protein 26
MDTKKQFDELLDDIGIAMMTTRSADGHLRSRAMANQKRASGADLWFVTSAGTDKLRDLSQDPHVNLSYYKDSSREWISVSGIASVSRDRRTIQELYEPDWKMWFTPQAREDDPLAGTVDDPQITLIGVTIHQAKFFAQDRATPLVLYEVALGWLTGTSPDFGEVKTLNR